MSKKCCGMIYSDDEKVCKVCGKTLTDDTDEDISTISLDGDSDEVEKTSEDEDVETDEDIEEIDESGENEEVEETGDYEASEDSVEEEPKEKSVNYLKKHIEREAILDQIYDDNGFKKNDRIKEDKEKVPYKGAGIFTLILAILGLFAIGAVVYFIVLNPYYIKSGEADKTLNYPELASVSDAEEMSELLIPYDATQTDATEQ